MDREQDGGAEWWLSRVPNTDVYGVVGADGRIIGFVRKVYLTIEKEIPGKQYVAWRRTAKTPSWRWWLKSEVEPGGRYVRHRATRKQAVEELLRDYRASNPPTIEKEG